MADSFLSSLSAGRPAVLSEPTPKVEKSVQPTGIEAGFLGQIKGGRPFALGGEIVTDSPQLNVESAKKTNAFRARPIEQLVDDEEFDPITFIQQNPESANDPDTKQKLIEIAKARQAKPVNLVRIGLGLIPAGVEAVKGFVKGSYEAGKALASAQSNAQIGNVAGTIQDVAELGASIETAAVSDADLLRRGFRKVVETFSGPLTDAEWEQRLFGDAEVRNQVETTAQGKGAAAKKYFDTDVAEVLKEAGLGIDPTKVQEMSAATDLLNFIPAGSALRNAGKTFKRTAEGIELVDAAGKTVAQVAKKGSKLEKTVDAFNKVYDKATSTAGEVSVQTGKALKDTVKKVGGIPGAAAAGAIIGGVDSAVSGGVVGATTALALPRVAAKVGDVLIESGARLQGKLPPGRLYRLAKAAVDNPATRGAAAGLGLGLPKDLVEIAASKQGILSGLGDAALATAPAGFAATNVLAGDTEKEKAQALAGQAAVGAVFGAAAEGAQKVAPAFDVVQQGIGRPENVTNPSAISNNYGSNSVLDKLHADTLAGLPEQVRNRISAARELVRPTGAEVYVLPASDFGTQVAEFYRQQVEAAGKVLDADQLKSIAEDAASEGGAKGLFVDNFNLGGKKKKVIFLNSDGGALAHETGHLFDSLFKPEDRQKLIDLVHKSYSLKEQGDFKADYDARMREIDPKYPGLSRAEVTKEIIAESISAVLDGLPLEKLGTPKPLARALYQKIGDVLGIDAGKTDLGLRKDFALIGTAENLVRAKAADTVSNIKELGKIDLTKVDVGLPKSQPPATPQSGPVIRPAQPVEQAPAPNIRATREEQNAFAKAQPIDEGLANAQKFVAESNKYTPKQKEAFVKVGAVLAQAGPTPPPMEVTYNSIKTDKYRAGRRTRREEQQEGYQKEAAGAMPESVRMQTQKVIVPNRVEVAGDEVILHAFSLDKVISNIDHVISEANRVKALGDIPYDAPKGKLTVDAANDLVRDIQNYTRNQANGYSGSGKPVVIPEGYAGRVPERNTGYSPVSIPDDKANFINILLAGGYSDAAPPRTNRRSNIRIEPANVTARKLAVANARPILPAAASTPGKNFFKDFGVEIAEFNPLRDKLFREGVDIGKLEGSNERLKLSELESVKLRNDLDFSRPSTDLIRAGFMPDPKKAIRVTDEDVARVASDYARTAGIDYTPYEEYRSISPETGKEIADWFDTAKHEPENPKVQEAYRALIDETKAQYEAAVAAGYTIEPFTGQGEPYASSADAVNDIRKNKHLYFLVTDPTTFGSGDKLAGNPMLEPSGISIDGRELLNNDLFRAVHDLFGHAKQGYEFGPRGEFNAFLAHASMFSPKAVQALAAETLAQNAWVNFGKHLRREDGSVPARGDKDFIPLQERPFADQKNTVVPDSILREVLGDRIATKPAELLSLEEWIKSGKQKGTQWPILHSAIKQSKPVNATLFEQVVSGLPHQNVAGAVEYVKDGDVYRPMKLDGPVKDMTAKEAARSASNAIDRNSSDPTEQRITEAAAAHIGLLFDPKGTALEQVFGDLKYRPAIDKMLEAARSILREKHGDTMKLYRAESVGDNPRNIFSYALDRKTAEEYARGDRPISEVEVPVDAILWIDDSDIDSGNGRGSAMEVLVDKRSLKNNDDSKSTTEKKGPTIRARSEKL